MILSNPGIARRARVVVTQHRLLHYRQAFFERLRQACADRNIELRLVHGQASAFEALKKDTGHLDWADIVQNRFVRIGGVDLVWQPYPAELRDADLVVLIQENRLLSNYPWLLRLRSPAFQRVAYWGHGRNLQSIAPNGFRERWKRWFVNRVDWWFAYTATTRSILRVDGFPDERIAVLNNAIDNNRFVQELSEVDEAQLQSCHDSLRSRPGSPIGIYCGSLYPDKRLDLLVAAGDIVHSRCQDFRLAVIGDGPSRSLVTDAAVTRPWLRWVGVQRGLAKAAWFRVSNAYLSPGAVGLHVLDAFCAGLPMITTVDARHGPEIAYLQSDRNGFVVNADAQAIADAYLKLLQDSDRMNRIRTAAAQDGQRYTLDNMVNNFVEGIERCLAMPRLR